MLIIIICVISTILLVGADQLFKYLAVANLVPGENVEIIKLGDTDILRFALFKNTGAAFSSFEGYTAALSVVTIIFIGFMIYFIIKYLPKKPFLLGCAISIIAGGIGNLIDRMFLGYVVDFIRLWPFNFIFNFADILVVLGAIFLLIYFIFFDSRKEDNTEETESVKENE